MCRKDDMRPEIAAAPYDRPYMSTPNLDAFIASPGTATFKNAHAQMVSYCTPVAWIYFADFINIAEDDTRCPLQLF